MLFFIKQEIIVGISITVPYMQAYITIGTQNITISKSCLLLNSYLFMNIKQNPVYDPVGTTAQIKERKIFCNTVKSLVPNFENPKTSARDMINVTINNNAANTKYLFFVLLSQFLSIIN